MRDWARRSGQQVLRVVLLVLIVAVSGVALGLAAGYPVSRIELVEADAVRLDHSRLAGEVDPAAAVVTEADLELGWEPGEPAIAAFGLLGSEICGREVPLPPHLSEVTSAVFVNPTDDAVLISQAVRLDRWQSARGYVDDLDEAVSDCERFYRPGVDGERVEMVVTEESSSPPVLDYVGRTFRAADGAQVQTWSVMAVGDVVIAVFHSSPSRPRQGFLRGLEQEILMRVDPEDFAPGGTTTTLPPDAPGGTEPETPNDGSDPTTTTVLDEGAADETEAGN